MKKNSTFHTKTFSILVIIALTIIAAAQSYAQTCALTIGISKVNPTCQGDCNGSITANPANGTGSYSYSWNTGATAKTINALCAGTYTVTVTDLGNQCTATKAVTIQKGRVGSTITTTNASCGECNGSISVQPHGGNGQPYTFLWSNGETTATITGLCAGVTYTVTINDRLGCTQVCKKKITSAGTPFTVSENIVNNTACPPADCNGSITVTPSVTNGNYSYLWNTGATTQTIDELCAGDYTVTVTNGAGCSVTETYTVEDDSDCGNCNGDFTTYTMGGWGNSGTPGQYMAANFESCFGEVVIGDPCGYTITLTTVQAVQDFLPQGGQPAALTQNYNDPGDGDITVLAGQVLAVQFALGFDDCDPDFSGSDSDLGDQVYIGSNSLFQGWSIQAIYDTARKVLSGCASNYTPQDMNAITTEINENYDEGGDDGAFACPAVAARMASAELQMSAYPNPFTSTLTVTVDETVDLKITDPAGRIIQEFQQVSGTLDIDANLQNGIYYITAERQGSMRTLKVVKTE